MKVFVAGAEAAIGLQLVAQLLANGHDVVGMTRLAADRAHLRSLGARAIVADALDRPAVARAVVDAAPEIVVDQLAAGTYPTSLRRIGRDREVADRLRAQGGTNLLAAARAAGVRRVVAHSCAGWPLARSGGPVKNEDAPLDPDPPRALRSMVTAIGRAEQAVAGVDWAEGVVLRYGILYGPGTAISREPDSALARWVTQRRLPLVGSANGIWSFVHVADAAAATVMAVEHAAAGIYQVVDDEPAPVHAWLPELARVLGAGTPRRVPRAVARLSLGEAATVLLTEARGASNHKARRELGWVPDRPSWRTGFKEVLA